ncbi:MAG: VOC family protein [Actinobacteria bacterium]|nr:VOC family protein [Actinomycetota bacterium]
MSSLNSITLVVDDYDRAISYFCGALGFTLTEDTDMGKGKRWVVISPEVGKGASLLIAKATTESQIASVGNQTGGRVAFFLHTDTFDTDYSKMVANGINFIEEPRLESYGKVVVFKDLYGNKWDFIGRTA